MPGFREVRGRAMLAPGPALAHTAYMLTKRTLAPKNATSPSPFPKTVPPGKKFDLTTEPPLDVDRAVAAFAQARVLLDAVPAKRLAPNWF